MKHKTHRLLSILMVFAIICTMLPTAWAANTFPLAAYQDTLDSTTTFTTIGADQESEWYKTTGLACTYKWDIVSGADAATLVQDTSNPSSAKLTAKTGVKTDTRVTVQGIATSNTDSTKTYTASATVTVKANSTETPGTEKLTFNVPKETKVAKGKTKTITATLSGTSDFSGYTVEWQSSSAGYFDVNGKAPYSNTTTDVKSDGTCSIEVTGKTKTGTVDVSITATLKKDGKAVTGNEYHPRIVVIVEEGSGDNPSTGAGTITPANPSVTVDGTVTLTAAANQASTTFDSVDWTVTPGTGDVSYKRTIDKNITLTGTKAGTVTVSAVLYNGSTKVGECPAVTVTVEAAKPEVYLYSSSVTANSDGSYTVPASGMTMRFSVRNGSGTYSYDIKKTSGTTGAVGIIDSGSDGTFNFIRGNTAGTVTYEITASQSGTAVTPKPITVTLTTTSTDIPSSDVLTTTDSRSVNAPYHGWKRISVQTTRTDANYVRWEVTSGTGVIGINNEEQTSNMSSVKLIRLNNNSAGIRIYGRSNGTATLTATLYRGTGNSSNEVRIGNSLSFTVTVNNGVLTTSNSNISMSTSGSWATATVSTSSSYSGYTVEWSVLSNNRGTIYINDRQNTTDFVSTRSTTLYRNSTSSNTASTSIYVYGYTTGTATLRATLLDSSGRTIDSVDFTVTVGRNSGFSLSPSPSNTSSVYLYDRYWDDRYDDDYYYDRYYQDFSVTPYLNGSSIYNSSSYDIYYTWTVNGTTVQSNNNSSSSYNSRSYRLYASNSNLNRYSNRSNSLTCSVSVYNRNASTTTANRLYYDTVTWTVYTDYNDSYGDYTVSATVYDTNSGYSFNERDDKNGSSIISQMENKFNSNESIDYVRFHDVTDTYGDLSASTSRDYYYSSSRSNYDLRDVTFTPDRVGRTGTATFDCTVYGTRDSSYRCTIRIKVEEGNSSSSKGDIEYSAKAGNSVDFSASDFRSWWRDNYSRGDLDYVRFTSVSSGNLYANYSSSSSRGTNVVSSSNATSCYYSPSSRQTGINDLTFVPSSSSSSSVTIRFTAYGTTSSSSSSNNSLTGKVVISYTNASVSTINYSTTGTRSVNLSASDFTSRYRDAVGSSSPSNMTIRFKSVPTNGTLAIGSTNLTSSNISSYNFSGSSSGSNRISDVKYTPNSNSNSSDTVSYDCYTGNTLRFSGSISFSNKADTTTQIPTNVVVSYSTTGGNVNFGAADFYNKNSAMLSASYLTFGTPSSGSLYAGSSPAVSGTQFAYVSSPSASYQTVSTLSYRPAAGFSGTATIPFTAYNANGTQAASGTVSITVSQPAAPAPTFGDVSTKAWYYNDVTTLAQANIVNGRSDGKFYPNDPVNYGEALKLILLAAGYDRQTELSGANWAQNYLNLAISNSILPGAASDYNLSQKMDRTTVATVSAKALKLTPVTSGTSPYADTSDSYVLALTNAGIVQGDSSSGTQMWNGTKNLTRAEVSRIVLNIYKYRNAAPGGSTSTNTNTPTVDTNQPSWLG